MNFLPFRGKGRSGATPTSNPHPRCRFSPPPRSHPNRIAPARGRSGPAGTRILPGRPPRPAPQRAPRPGQRTACLPRRPEDTTRERQSHRAVPAGSHRFAPQPHLIAAYCGRRRRARPAICPPARRGLWARPLPHLHGVGEVELLGGSRELLPCLVVRHGGAAPAPSSAPAVAGKMAPKAGAASPQSRRLPLVGGKQLPNREERDSEIPAPSAERGRRGQRGDPGGRRGCHSDPSRRGGRAAGASPPPRR